MTKQKKKFMPVDESIAPEALYTVAIVSVIAILMLIIVLVKGGSIMINHFKVLTNKHFGEDL